MVSYYAYKVHIYLYMTYMPDSSRMGNRHEISLRAGVP
jgi:hypothetical protein